MSQGNSGQRPADLLSFSRLLLGAVVLFELSRREVSFLVLPSVALASVSDYFDGRLARKGGQPGARGLLVDNLCDAAFLAMVFSGMALVITLTVSLRKVFRLEAYLTTKHFDAMAKLVLVTSLVVLYAYLTEFFMAWYSGEEVERSAFWNRLFGGYWWATWIMLVCNGMVPQMLWFRRVRHSIPALFVISLFINIGMWFERFVIIVVSLSHEFIPFAWGVYRPSIVEMGILFGSFAWFGFWFLLFCRILPPVAIAELKEVLPAPIRHRREMAHG